MSFLIKGRELGSWVVSWLRGRADRQHWHDAGLPDCYFDPDQWVVTDYYEAAYDAFDGSDEYNVRILEQNNGGMPGQVMVRTNAKDTKILDISARRVNQKGGSCGQPEIFEAFLYYADQGRGRAVGAKSSKSYEDFGSW